MCMTLNFKYTNPVRNFCKQKLRPLQILFWTTEKAGIYFPGLNHISWTASGIVVCHVRLCCKDRITDPIDESWIAHWGKMHTYRNVTGICAVRTKVENHVRMADRVAGCPRSEMLYMVALKTTGYIHQLFPTLMISVNLTFDLRFWPSKSSKKYESVFCS